MEWLSAFHKTRGSLEATAVRLCLCTSAPFTIVSVFSNLSSSEYFLVLPSNYKVRSGCLSVNERWRSRFEGRTASGPTLDITRVSLTA